MTDTQNSARPLSEARIAHIRAQASAGARVDPRCANDLLGEIERLRAILAQPAEQQDDPVGWQFLDNGQWHNGDDRIKDHRANTEAAGYQTRNVYARPAAQAVNFPANDDVVSALKTLINVARTINRGSPHAVRVQGDDEPQYRQRKEWVEYLLETCDEAEAKLNGIKP